MDNSTDNLTTVKPQEVVPQTVSEADRRAAIRRIGRYSAYAAPAVLAMMSGKAVAFSGDCAPGSICE